jgi:hypothetical protein
MVSRGVLKYAREENRINMDIVNQKVSYLIFTEILAVKERLCFRFDVERVVLMN